MGVVACLLGLGVLVWSDAALNKEKSTSGPSPIFGDILCLIGAFLYGVSNTGQEISVKKWSQTEFLAMIGLFGAPISFIQLMVLERHEVVGIGWNVPIIALIVGFALLLFIMYSITPHMMVLSGSTLFNLSLLTSDAYAVLFGLFLFHSRLHWAYWIALVIIVAGLCLYNIRNEPASSEYDRPLSGNINGNDPEATSNGAQSSGTPTQYNSTDELDIPVMLDDPGPLSTKSATSMESSLPLS